MSVGVLALGTAGMQAAYAPGLSSMEASKPWSVSASLRAFYDDNYTTSPSSIAQESFGFDISPSASLNLPMDQTFIGLSYVYSMKYYEDRVNNSADHSHQFNGKLDHAFSERYKIELDDSFVIAQEPTILAPPGTPAATFLRLNGNNIRNTGSGWFTAQVTSLLSSQLGYENTVYDYDNATYSALLDRMEQRISGNLRYQLVPQTVGILGYSYSWTDYRGSGVPLFPVPSIKDNRSHRAVIGADHNFNSTLNGSIRVGAEFTEYSNVPGGADQVSPYADANLTYAYSAGNSLQVGVRQQRVPLDIASALDQEATSFYGTLSHRITSRITGTFLGQYQRAEFNGGPLDGNVDNFFIMGLNVSYKINQWWLVDGGYNFDRLDADVAGRNYTRNRAYVGVRATY